MPRIAAAFSIQPPIHLIKEYENSVVFPNEPSGKFNPSALCVGALYEVQGSEPKPSTTPANALTPFGAYPYPQSQTLQFQQNIPRKVNKKQIKKTILLANLSTRDVQKPSCSSASRLVHNVITQVIISLDPSACNLTQAAQSVKMQVGFEVILLDSKLFPLLDNESTSGVEFWRSTRKIIAASRTTYEKLAGVPDQELSRADEDIATTPCKKIKSSECNEKIDVIIEKLDFLNKNLTFVENVKKLFECVICKSTISSPMVSSCCQRIIGCKLCVTTWRESSSRCPLCSVVTPMSNAFELKGFDDMTFVHSTTEGTDRSTSTPATVIDVSDNSSSEEFEDLPPFSSRSQ